MNKHLYNHPTTRSDRRRLRKNATGAEQKLWSILRNRLGDIHNPLYPPYFKGEIIGKTKPLKGIYREEHFTKCCDRPVLMRRLLEEY